MQVTGSFESFETQITAFSNGSRSSFGTRFPVSVASQSVQHHHDSAAYVQRKPEMRNGHSVRVAVFPRRYGLFVVRPGGFEPPTSCSGGKRSIP